MLRSCAVVVWMTCLLATAWGRYLSEDDYSMIPMQDMETEAVTETQPIENGKTGSQQVQQMGYAYGNQQQTTTSSELPPTSSELPSTSAPTQMLDIPMPYDNNYNQYSGYGSGYGEEYNSGASGEESGSGLIGFNLVPENEGSGEGSGSFSPSDCPNLADGNYAMSACGHQFLTCSNGNPFIFDCPAELVYNPQHDMCDWPNNMGCENQESGSGEGSGDFHGPSDCPTLADGNYAMSACGHQFLACSNGLPHVMDCPANLVYNAEFNMCDWPHNVVGCEGSGGEITSGEPLPEESGSGAASGEESGESSGEASGLTPTELMILPLPPVEQPETTTRPVTTSTAQIVQESTTESSGAASGEESSGEESGLTPTEPMILPLPPVEQPETTTRPVTTSTAQIIQESTTESSGLELPPSTSTAEPETSGIEETTPLTEGSSAETETEPSGEEGSAEEIEEGQQTTTAMPTSTSTQSDSTIISVVVRRGQLDESLLGQSTDCSARADGNYQLARCSGRFLSCSNGIGHLMNCPDQLFFNAQLNACDFSECDLH